MNPRKVSDPSRQHFGDGRDRLRPTCRLCGAPLVEASLDPQDVAGPAEHGEYACGAKYLAWGSGAEGSVCVRACERKANSAEGSVTAGDIREEIKRVEARRAGLDLDEEEQDS